jgi:hypothetical protein
LPFTVSLTVDTLSSRFDFYLFQLETLRLQLCNRDFHLGRHERVLRLRRVRLDSALKRGSGGRIDRRSMVSRETPRCMPSDCLFMGQRRLFAAGPAILRGNSAAKLALKALRHVAAL